MCVHSPADVPIATEPTAVTSRVRLRIVHLKKTTQSTEQARQKYHVTKDCDARSAVPCEQE